MYLRQYDLLFIGEMSGSNDMEVEREVRWQSQQAVSFPATVMVPISWTKVFFSPRLLPGQICKVKQGCGVVTSPDRVIVQPQVQPRWPECRYAWFQNENI